MWSCTGHRFWSILGPFVSFVVIARNMVFLCDFVRSYFRNQIVLLSFIAKVTFGLILTECFYLIVY